ncbi:MAG: thermonuclease family protein [Parvularculales bacterium]
MQRIILITLSLLTATLAVIASLSAQPKEEPRITGHAQIVDGDDLIINGEQIRLRGIDALEMQQLCNDNEGEFPCGQIAAQALETFINNRPVTCHAEGRDNYNRLLASCTVEGEDIGAWSVRHGWAVAYRRYSDKYIEQEREAQKGDQGVWGWAFTYPEVWRRKNREETPQR